MDILTEYSQLQKAQFALASNQSIDEFQLDDKIKQIMRSLPKPKISLFAHNNDFLQQVTDKLVGKSLYINFDQTPLNYLVFYIVAQNLLKLALAGTFSDSVKFQKLMCYTNVQVLKLVFQESASLGLVQTITHSKIQTIDISAPITLELIRDCLELISNRNNLTVCFEIDADDYETIIRAVQTLSIKKLIRISNYLAFTQGTSKVQFNHFYGYDMELINSICQNKFDHVGFDLDMPNSKDNQVFLEINHANLRDHLTFNVNSMFKFLRQAQLNLYIYNMTLIINEITPELKIAMYDFLMNSNLSKLYFNRNEYVEISPNHTLYIGRIPEYGEVCVRLPNPFHLTPAIWNPKIHRYFLLHTRLIIKTIMLINQELPLPLEMLFEIFSYLS